MTDANELHKFNTDIYPRFKDKYFKCLMLRRRSDSIILESRITPYFVLKSCTDISSSRG
jgi:hypothetical protein